MSGLDAGHDEDPARSPRVLRMLATGGRMAWQFVGIMLALWILGQAYVQLAQVLLSVLVALVVAAVVTPVGSRLERLGLRRSIATTVALVGLVALLAATTYTIVVRVSDQLPGLADDVRAQREPVLRWLEDSALHLSPEEVAALLDRTVAQVQGGDEAEESAGAGGTAAAVVTGEETDTDQGDGATDPGSDDGGGDAADEPLPDDQEGPSPTLAVGMLRGAFGFAQVAGFVLLGFVLAFFLVRDRDVITDGTVRHLVGGGHDRLAYVVLRRSWRSLMGYVRASLLVGAIDAALIGLVLFVVGVPLAGVLTVLTFLAAFVPVVGAVSVGLLSVVVALVAEGPGAAAIVGVTVLLVQQLDGNVLQPVLVRQGTGLHPAATILALTIGGILGGVLGALLAVPLMAMLVAAAAALLEAGVGHVDEPVEPPEPAPTIESTD